MKQASLKLNLNVKKTRKQVFLEQMEQVVPWAVLVELHLITLKVRQDGRHFPCKPCFAFISCSSGSRCPIRMKAHMGADAESGMVHTMALFTQVINHEHGWPPVVENPLRVGVDSFWRKAGKVSNSKAAELLRQELNKGIGGILRMRWVTTYDSRIMASHRNLLLILHFCYMAFTT